MKTWGGRGGIEREGGRKGREVRDGWREKSEGEGAAHTHTLTYTCTHTHTHTYTHKHTQTNLAVPKCVQSQNLRKLSCLLLHVPHVKSV